MWHVYRFLHKVPQGNGEGNKFCPGRPGDFRAHRHFTFELSMITQRGEGDNMSRASWWERMQGRRMMSGPLQLQDEVHGTDAGRWKMRHGCQAGPRLREALIPS